MYPHNLWAANYLSVFLRLIKRLCGTRSVNGHVMPGTSFKRKTKERLVSARHSMTIHSKTNPAAAISVLKFLSSFFLYFDRTEIDRFAAAGRKSLNMRSELSGGCNLISQDWWPLTLSRLLIHFSFSFFGLADSFFLCQAIKKEKREMGVSYLMFWTRRVLLLFMWSSP